MTNARRRRCAIGRTVWVGFALVWALLVCARAQAAETGQIKGVVRHEETGKGIPSATVVLQCTCLTEEKVTQTNDNGLYVYRGLPAGQYTLQVFAGKAEVDKTFSVERGQPMRANVTINPGEAEVITVVVKPPLRVEPEKTYEYTQRELELPAGNNPSRDAATTAVELSPHGDRDARGFTIANSTSAEIDYRVDGGNANDPSFGTPAMPTVTEFIGSVEVREAGYSAEYGGASGGGVSARRISGTNVLRGNARFTFTPRLGKPRFVVHTDNAVRATEVPDYQMQGVVALSGPIIKDKLFWSGGISAIGGRSSLRQTFHARVDRNGSGGFEDCPYENGAGDCADGGDYIATERFADQTFHTRAVGLSGFGGIDWAITPKHRIGVTVRAAPNFVRRSYRRPANLSNLDPDAFGASPNADPLGGASTVANGVVNDAFGWDRGNAVQAVLNYEGRVADDNLEIDGTLSYFQSMFHEGWRLDDPSLRNRTATQRFDNEGTSLFELLDDAGRLDLAPGVKEACNDRNLPGLACPVRSWMSGGLGQTQRTRARRIEGRLALTHFFEAAGPHQLKYGTQIEHVDRRRILQYSGANEPDFARNCSAMDLQGGGEWCYDEANDAYLYNRATRVDNHRLVVVNGDNPNLRRTLGYGRVRKEQGELRAIATPLGAGVRVPRYDELVATQNYAVFLQDRWAVRDNLFLDAGVRWAMQDMRDILGERALFIWDNVAPRTGLVYDWTQEGRSRLYASYGWFFQNLPLSLSNRVFGGLVNVARSYENNDCQGRSVEIAGVARPTSDDGQPTQWCVDAPVTTSGLTEGAVVPRLRGQFDQQFQFGYDQEVIEDLTLGVSWQHRDLMRAVEDISTDGGLNYIVANPGVAVAADDIEKQQAECDRLTQELAALPEGDEMRAEVARARERCDFLVDAYQKVGTLFERPRRNYDAFTFEVRKRFAKNWLLIGSYTYSRNIGNYDGFVDPITGAINLGSSLQYDTPELVRNSFGRLSFDSPHRVKLDGFYTFDLDKAGSFTVGASFRIKSGYPISLRTGSSRYSGQFPIYVLPRGAGGRLEPNYQLNASLQYAYPLPGTTVLAVGARLLNVTNAKAVLRVDEVYSVSNTRPIAGGDLQDLKHAKIQNPGQPTEFFQRTVLPRQGNYGVEAAFQNPIAAQFDVQLMF